MMAPHLHHCMRMKLTGSYLAAGHGPILPHRLFPMCFMYHICGMQKQLILQGLGMAPYPHTEAKGRRAEKSSTKSASLGGRGRILSNYKVTNCRQKNENYSFS